MLKLTLPPISLPCNNLRGGSNTLLLLRFHRRAAASFHTLSSSRERIPVFAPLAITTHHPNPTHPAASTSVITTRSTTSRSQSMSTTNAPSNRSQPTTTATTIKPTLLYASRTLRSQSNTPNGEVSAATIFHYRQSPDTPHIVSATYSGGSIVQGHLIGTLLGSNVLTMRYHHVNEQGRLMTGMCVSTPEMLEDGRLRLHERWEWTSGGVGSGESVVEEVVGE